MAKVPVTVYLETYQKQEVEELQQKSGFNFSKFVRDKLDEELKKHNKKGEND